MTMAPTDGIFSRGLQGAETRHMEPHRGGLLFGRSRECCTTEDREPGSHLKEQGAQKPSGQHVHRDDPQCHGEHHTRIQVACSQSGLQRQSILPQFMFSVDHLRTVTECIHLNTNNNNGDISEKDNTGSIKSDPVCLIVDAESCCFFIV